MQLDLLPYNPLEERGYIWIAPMVDSTTPVSDLFQRWRQLRDQGQAAPPESLCPDRPDLLTPLRERIDAFLGVKQSVESPTEDATRPDTPRQLGSTERSAFVPRLLDGYLIERVLGRGGMGVVYQARHPHMDLTVALKTMRGEAESAEGAERFVREAKAVALLTHPHIVRMFDVGLADGSHYFTMALVTGGNLKDRRKELGSEPRRVAILMEKVARAVHHAHERGIIHRDLKPGNILIDEHGEPLVSDFGLAKFLDSSDDLTMSGNMPGTVPYMAPEQLAGPRRGAGPASDIWALGVILYELLTGRRPFLGDDSIVMMQEIIGTEPPRPRTIKPEIDRTLETIVLTCLEKSPARRYGSAEALADDLARWLRGEPIGVRPEGWLRRGWRRVQRRPVAWAASALLLLGAVAGLLWWTSAEPSAEIGKPAETEDAGAVLRSLQAQLKGGAKLNLIDGKGPPRWWRWSLWSRGPAFTTAAKDGTWLLDSRDVALMELMPDPCCNHYRLEAELSHEEGTEQALIGLYVGGEEVPAQSGDYFLVDVAFADMGWLKGKGRVQMYNLNLNPTISVNTLDSKKWEWALKPAEAKGKTWHRVAVEVHPGYLVARMDDVERRVTSEQLQENLPRLLNKRLPVPNPAPSLGPRHACGIFLRAAAVSVRHVSITPLQP